MLAHVLANLCEPFCNSLDSTGICGWLMNYRCYKVCAKLGTKVVWRLIYSPRKRKDQSATKKESLNNSSALHSWKWCARQIIKSGSHHEIKFSMLARLGLYYKHCSVAVAMQAVQSDHTEWVTATKFWPGRLRWPWRLRWWRRGWSWRSRGRGGRWWGRGRSLRRGTPPASRRTRPSRGWTRARSRSPRWSCRSTPVGEDNYYLISVTYKIYMYI